VGIHFRERQGEAERTAALVKGCGGEGGLFQADIRDAPQVDAMMRDLTACWGHLDVMVCNAGQAWSGLVMRLRPEQWAAVIDVNLTGTFHCLRAAASVMLPQGNGSVVVIGSYAGFQGRTGQSAYSASKAGLLGLAKAAAREWGSSNIRINVICPGWQRTDLAGSAMRSLVDGMNDSNHILGRTVDLEEVARSVYYLALLKDASGQVWNLDSRIL
jgi:3-oxoacyl-[acyl-carrier protein] reductase